MDIHAYMNRVGLHAKEAARVLARADTNSKNAALEAIADALEANKDQLKADNQLDLKAGREKGLSAAMLDRLALTDKVISGMAEGLRQVAQLPDPVGEVSDMSYRPSGIQLGKMRVPLGVVGIIYESRPNVTADAAALCLKSGNATILRGGSEAIHSNRAIAACVQQGLEQVGLPKACVQVVDTTDREAVGELLRMPQYVDVIVPRGGKGLIERVSKDSQIPVIKHLDGICHVYIDADASQDMAINIALNAKTHRYGVCNAMETLLVHQSIAADILPRLEKAYQAKNVELRGCEQTQSQIACIPAVEEDWSTEYLAPILSIKIVESIEQAVTHINNYGSHHTDAIVTQDYAKSRQFMREVDSSSVMVNASTRFADGFEYGLGAEIGISTDKIHARGPVGLHGLTSQKYIVFGEGQIRE